jgi:AmmeMemoRadiSam system protein B
VDAIISSLSTAGLLEDAQFLKLRAEAFAAFAAAPNREPILIGQEYPDCPQDCRRFFQDLLDRETDGEKPPPPSGTPFAFAAPHVSIEGGWECYRETFADLQRLPAREDRTFVILATSHYGPPERFGVTAKPFVTPYGATTPDLELLASLRALAPDALIEEDYFHSVDHSVEMHVVWLQHLFGADVRILPILVGGFVNSTYRASTPPESDPAIAQFFTAMRTLVQNHGDRLVFLLSIDLSHKGPQYGEQEAFNEGDENIIAQDQERISKLEVGDAAGFWQHVQTGQDPLNWCGNAPLYTLLQAHPAARAEVLSYGHWAIQEGSVVSFAGMRFVQ